MPATKSNPQTFIATLFKLTGRALTGHGNAVYHRRKVASVGMLFGMLFCALLVAVPIGNAARAQTEFDANKKYGPKIVRKNGGLEVKVLLRTGACSDRGPVRLAAPAGTLPIRYTVAVTLTIVGKKGCNTRHGSYALIWKFSVPNVSSEDKALIVYVKRGPTARATATAYLLR